MKFRKHEETLYAYGNMVSWGICISKVCTVVGPSCHGVFNISPPCLNWDEHGTYQGPARGDEESLMLVIICWSRNPKLEPVEWFRSMYWYCSAGPGTMEYKHRTKDFPDHRVRFCTSIPHRASNVNFNIEVGVWMGSNNISCKIPNRKVSAHLCLSQRYYTSLQLT
jgi:hypothetical protein